MKRVVEIVKQLLKCLINMKYDYITLKRFELKGGKVKENEMEKKRKRKKSFDHRNCVRWGNQLKHVNSYHRVESTGVEGKGFAYGAIH